MVRTRRGTENPHNSRGTVYELSASPHFMEIEWLIILQRDAKDRLSHASVDLVRNHQNSCLGHLLMVLRGPKHIPDDLLTIHDDIISFTVNILCDRTGGQTSLKHATRSVSHNIHDRGHGLHIGEVEVGTLVSIKIK